MDNSFTDIFRISVSTGNKLKWDNFLLPVLAKGKKCQANTMAESWRSRVF